MKRKDLIRELEQLGCVLYRHGGRHHIYLNTVTGQKSPIPRHNEVKDSLCRLIRKQLGLS